MIVDDFFQVIYSHIAEISPPHYAITKVPNCQLEIHTPLGMHNIRLTILYSEQTVLLRMSKITYEISYADPEFLQKLTAIYNRIISDYKDLWT